MGIKLVRAANAQFTRYQGVQGVHRKLRARAFEQGFGTASPWETDGERPGLALK